MAASYTLKVYSGASVVFTADVEGEPSIRREVLSVEATEPPAPREVQDTWDWRRCKMQSSNGQAVDEFAALLAIFDPTASNYPTALKVFRGSTEVLALPSSTHERFRVEAIAWDPTADPATRNGVDVVEFSIRASAVKRKANASSVVLWEQTVEEEYDAANLRTLTWTTRVTTKEGTNAKTVAVGLAAIDASVVGPAYTFETAGPSGANVRVEDADESNGRTPTVATVVSRVRQLGQSIGMTSAAGGPGDPRYTITTKTLGDGSIEEVTVASARGVNASAFVASKKPGRYSDEEIVDDPLTRTYTGTWTYRDTAQAARADFNWTIKATIRGGHRSFKFRKLANNQPPLRSEGSVSAWLANVTITTERRGVTGTPKEMPFPAELGNPWVLDRDASDEDEPVLVEESPSGAANNLYRREARLVYRAGTKPKQSIIEMIAANNGAKTDSYFYGDQGTS